MLFRSPGHARKEGRHVAKMGASRGFSLSVAPVFGFSRGMTGQVWSLGREDLLEEGMATHSSILA